MLVIDKFCYISNFRYRHPLEKWLYSLATLIFCIVSRSILLGVVVLTINAFLNTTGAGLNGKRYWQLMRIPILFVLLSTFMILINFSTEPLDAFAWQPGSKWYITASWAGIQQGLRLITTALAAVSCLYYFSLNTTITDMAEAYRILHFPELMIELTILIYRYIFIIMDDAMHIRNSQDARLGGQTFKASLHAFASMLQAIFIRSMIRSRRQYQAMEARGYDGVIHTLPEFEPINKERMLGIIVFECLLLAYTIAFKQINPGGFW